VAIWVIAWLALMKGTSGVFWFPAIVPPTFAPGAA
jgi:hypothetical protein